MGRKILAIIVALITAFAVIFIVQMIATLFAPQPPKNFEYLSRDEILAYLNSVPVSVIATVLAGYVLGAFAGGFVVTKMTRRESPGISLPILIGVVLFLAGVVNFFVTLPGQPAWFIAASLISFIPFSLLGHRFAR